MAFKVQFRNAKGETLEPFNKNGFVYIPLQHKQEYSVCLINNHVTRADVELTIDGMTMGTFQVNAGSMSNIERPVGQK